MKMKYSHSNYSFMLKMSKRSLSIEDLNSVETSQEDTNKKSKIDTFKRRSLNTARVQTAFKCPLKDKTLINQKKEILKRPENLKAEIETLKKKHEQIDKEIEELKSQGHDESQLSIIIDKLHVFNQIKDAAQEVLGKLAYINRVTINEMHKRYNVQENDS